MKHHPDAAVAGLCASVVARLDVGVANFCVSVVGYNSEAECLDYFVDCDVADGMWNDDNTELTDALEIVDRTIDDHSDEGDFVNAPVYSN